MDFLIWLMIVIRVLQFLAPWILGLIGSFFMLAIVGPFLPPGMALLFFIIGLITLSRTLEESVFHTREKTIRRVSDG